MCSAATKRKCSWWSCQLRSILSLNLCQPQITGHIQCGVYHSGRIRSGRDRSQLLERGNKTSRYENLSRVGALLRTWTGLGVCADWPCLLWSNSSSCGLVHPTLAGQQQHHIMILLISSPLQNRSPLLLIFIKDASSTDGKAAVSLEKLKLFRHFYIMVVCYVYFTRWITRIVVILCSNLCCSGSSCTCWR